MTTHQELQAQLAALLTERPELFDHTRRVRDQHDAGPAASPVAAHLQGEHESRQLVLDNLRRVPRLHEALLANRQRHLERRAPVVTATTGPATCPFCGGQGEPVDVQSSSSRWTFSRLRDDCCPRALLESATRALRYARNPDGPESERTENAQRYLNLRGRIRRPEDQATLDALEAELRARAANRGPSYARQDKGSP